MQTLRQRPNGIGPIEAAVEVFCQSAISKGDFATPASRDRKLYESMRSAVRSLRSFGEPGEEAMQRMLNHDSRYVRLWIATELLVKGSGHAEKVLQELAASDGLDGLSASTVLNEFAAGKLCSPFPENEA